MQPPLTPEIAQGFLKGAAEHFERSYKNGDGDRAYWASVFNAERCTQIAARLAELEADRLFRQAPVRPEAIRETLKPADQLVLGYLMRNGSISAQEAFLNLKGMSSATLARRITTIIRAGHAVTRERPRNPETLKLYTRYVLADFGTSDAGLMAGVTATVGRRIAA